MLKFLTQKLRTHSINEEQVDEEHDSGTESDEEADVACSDERICSVSPSDTGCSMESPAPEHHQQDAHSSEEELEVINSNSKKGQSALRAASVCLPEKRKWSQVGDAGQAPARYSPENEENMSQYSNLSPPLHHACSSDEEVCHFLTSRTTPVQFRSSPPLEAVKPGKSSLVLQKGRSMSPPPKLLHYEVSPRKRSRRHVQRPYLDFEKMQQVNARSVTAWRNTGDHGGELSVFCW